jgi:acetyl esterase/lipase
MKLSSRIPAGIAAALLLALLAGSLRAQVPVPAQPGVKPDLQYGTAAGEKLFLDLYQPASGSDSAKLHPLVVMVHGGAWRAGSRKDFAAGARELAGKGFVVASVGYRFAPAHKFPAQLDDVQLAVRWLRAHVKEYGIDPTRVGAMGASAGGHLVALLGTRPGRAPKDAPYSDQSDAVQCVVDWFGPTDFTTSYRSDAPKQLIDWVNDFLGPRTDANKDNYRLASPALYVSKSSAPMLIVHGTADPLVPFDQSMELRDALKKAKVDVTLLRLEGGNHGFSEPAQFKKAWDESISYLVARLKP